MILQLNPPLPVETPNGMAFAHLVIDYSQDHHLLFTCFMVETGECWTFQSIDVKLQANISLGVRQT